MGVYAVNAVGTHYVECESWILSCFATVRQRLEGLRLQPVCCVVGYMLKNLSLNFGYKIIYLSIIMSLEPESMKQEL